MWVPVGASVPKLSPRDDPNTSQNRRRILEEVKFQELFIADEQPNNCMGAQNHSAQAKTPTVGVLVFRSQLKNVGGKSCFQGQKVMGSNFRCSTPTPPHPTPP